MCCLCNDTYKWLDVQVFSVSCILSVIWLPGDVKEPTNLSERVGDEIPGVVVWPCLWVGASHRVNLMHLSPLVRNVQEKFL